MSVAIKTKNHIKLHLGTFAEARVEINDELIVNATAYWLGCDAEGQFLALTLTKGSHAAIVDVGVDIGAGVHLTPTVEYAWLHAVRIGTQTLPVESRSLCERYDEDIVMIDCVLPISADGPYTLELV